MPGDHADSAHGRRSDIITFTVAHLRSVCIDLKQNTDFQFFLAPCGRDSTPTRAHPVIEWLQRRRKYDGALQPLLARRTAVSKPVRCKRSPLRL